MHDMHLTPIGEGNVLLEPGDGLDPSVPDGYLEELIAHLHRWEARRLLYDMKNVAVIDRLYYEWLCALHRACGIGGVDLVTVNIRPAAAYALTMILDSEPPFLSALDVNSVYYAPPGTVARPHVVAAAADTDGAQAACSSENSSS